MLQNTDENTPRENQSQKYDIIPPYSRYGSRFVTTSRNVLLYWIVNFVLLPTYASLFYLLLDDILHPLQPIPLLSEGVRFPLATIIGICALTPVLMNFFAPAHWQTGFKHLEVACMSSLLITSHLFFTPNTIAKPIVYALSLIHI